MDNQRDSLYCKNCGYQEKDTQANNCSRCGQSFHIHLHKLFHFIIHYLEDYFHFDNKFWKTIFALFKNSGKLTNDYLSGKVKSNFNPLSLYILCSTIFFFTFSSTVHHFFYMQNLKDGRSAFVEGFRYGTFLQKEFPSDAYTDTTIVVTDSVWQEDIEYMKEEYEFDLATEWERSLMIPRSIGALNMIQKDNIPIFGIAVNLYYDKLIKAIPKIFFVLVIFLALLTSLFSVRKTSESLIFAVHFQSFVFLSSSIFLLLVSFIDLIYPNDDILDLLIGVFVFCILLYFAKCFNSFNSKNNYFLSALKASLIWIFYGVLALGAITLFIFYKAWY